MCSFDDIATSRNEGSHTASKAALQNLTGNMYCVMDQTDLVLFRQRSKYNGNIQNQRRKTKWVKDKKFYREIRGRISHFVITKLQEQYKISDNNEELPLCTQVFRRTVGLPCRHDLKQRIYCRGRLRLSDIHRHWKFDKPEVTRAGPLRHPDDFLIDLALRLQEPAVYANAGHPRGSTAGPRDRRAHPASTPTSQRNPSAFEVRNKLFELEHPAKSVLQPRSLTDTTGVM